MTVFVLVRFCSEFHPKLALPLGSAWLLWQICQYRSLFASKIWFDLETKMEPKLQCCIFRCDCKLLRPRWVRIVHFFGSTLWYEFLLDLEASFFLGMKIDFFLLLVTEGYRRTVQSRLIYNQLRSIIWITYGLLTMFQIFARILAASFTVALHWLALLRKEVVQGSLLYPVDLVQRGSPELSDQLGILQIIPATAP